MRLIFFTFLTKPNGFKIYYKKAYDATNFIFIVMFILAVCSIFGGFIFKDLFIETNPIPVKTAMGMLGMIEPEIRLPLCEISEANRERLRQALEAYGLLKKGARVKTRKT